MKKYLLFLPAGLVAASIGLNFLMFGVLSWSYAVLTHEAPIALLVIEKRVAPQEYLVRLADPQGRTLGSYPVYGDQWRVDARFMKMKYWSSLLGLESRYALERLEGRYRRVEDQNNKQGLAHELGEPSTVENLLPAGWGLFVDTEYGSSTFMDMQEGIEYTILKTPTGLMARSSQPEDPGSGEASGFGAFVTDMLGR